MCETDFVIFHVQVVPLYNDETMNSPLKLEGSIGCIYIERESVRIPPKISYPQINLSHMIIRTN